jgi:hypothetical protein
VTWIDAAKRTRDVVFVLACAFVLAPAATAASGPSPDPVPQHVSPDPAPVKSTPAPVQQQPVASQPVVQATPRTVATTPAPVQQPTTTAARASRAPSKVHKARAHKAKRAKARTKRRVQHAASHATPPSVVVHPRAAVAAVRRVAHVLAVDAPRVAKSADNSSQQLAAAALLLLVIAGLSVLRLSMRMSDEMLRGRFG